MNNKALTMSLLAAGLAFFFVSSYVTSIEEDAKKRYGTEILVVVAKRDIKEMETITESMIYFKSIPKRYVEPSAVSLEKKEEDKDSAKTLKSLAGSVAIVNVKKDEQLTFNKLTEPSMRTGLATQVTPGKRAVAIPVNEISGVSKLVKPGDRVDLIAVLDLGGGKENKVSKTILQDVVILSIGRYVTNNIARVLEADPAGGKDKVRNLAEDFGFASVTLEVEPAQAQTLALVMANGDSALTLSLRNNDDIERVNFPAIVFSDILGPDAARVKGAAGKK